VLVLHTSVTESVVVPESVAVHGDTMYRAYQARTGGKSWTAIAREEGYSSGHRIRAEVEAWLTEAQALVTQESQARLMNLEVDRLDSLQAAYWPQAMGGHVPSGQLVLAVIRARIDLLGIADTSAISGDQHTVVVLAERGEYLKSLQRAADDPA
jgi:hypothetical protein